MSSQIKLTNNTHIWRLLAPITGIGLLVFIQQAFVVPYNNFAGQALQNALHIPWFALLTLFVLSANNKLFPTKSRVRFTLIILSLAISSELLQIFTNRNASVQDVLVNLIGASFAIVGTYIARNFQRPLIPLFALCTIMFLGVALIPSTYLLAHQYRNEQFPLLYAADDWRFRTLTRSTSSTHLATPTSQWSRSSRVLRIKWNNSRYPGITLHELHEDWCDYANLQISLYVHGTEPMPLTIAVGHNGKTGTSRFYKTVLPAGANTWIIPTNKLTRRLQGKRAFISKLILHTRTDQTGREISLASIRLLH